MVLWDLAKKDNWELILSDRRSVIYKNNTTPNDITSYYEPIKPIYANPNSHILLIGTASNSAKQHWFLGAKASQYLYVSPSPTTDFVSGVQVANAINVGLNRLTLVKFDNYDISPYILKLEIPYWLEDIYIEVWEYFGYLPPDEGNSEILDRLDAIEDKLDALENYGV